MRSFVESLMTASAVVLVAAGLVAGNAVVAKAQDSGWKLTEQAASVAPGTTVSPFDFSGCWSGSISDSSGNSGTGYINFVQSKKHITNASTAGLNITNVGAGSAPVSGNVKGDTFRLEHFGHHCKVGFKGGLGTSSDVVGSYLLARQCFRDGVKHSGSFDFTFDASGKTCQ